MEINNTSPLDEVRQALAGSWNVTSKTQGQDKWNVIELGMFKLYEATLSAGLHIVPFSDLTRTRVIEIYTNNETKSLILKMKENHFNLEENSLVRILFY